MNQQLQMPTNGCEKCGAYEKEPQHILRQRLIRQKDHWVCRSCAKDDQQVQG